MIRRIFAAALLALFAVAPAFAMTAASIPQKFSIPFANAAGGSFIRTIPTASQIGIQNGAASLTDGFPPLTFLPVSAGGVPPFGQDFNGVLKQITQWSRWQGAGGLPVYDGTFSSAIGGYPKGALLAGTTAGVAWFSVVDNNATNPDASGAGWVNLQAIFGGDSGSGGTSGLVPAPPSGSAASDQFLGAGGAFKSAVPPGTVLDFAGATAPTGYMLCFGQAVSRVAFAQLFVAIGTAFGVGDGSTTFNLPDLRGRVSAGADAMGGTAANRLTNVTISGGASLGNSGGFQTHTLTAPELPVITPQGSVSVTGTVPMSNQASALASGGAGWILFGGTTPITANATFFGVPFGGGQAHPTVQPTLVLNKIIKF